jgi:hypothetical protein
MQTQRIHSSGAPMFNVFGPLLEFLVTPAQTSGAFAVIRGIGPPGVAIPLHSHADPEVLFVLEGELEVVQDDGDSSRLAGCKAWRDQSAYLVARSMLYVMPRRGRPSCRSLPHQTSTAFSANSENPSIPIRHQHRRHPKICDVYGPSPPNTTTGWLLRRRMQLSA